MLVTRYFQRPKKSRPPDIHAAKKETGKKNRNRGWSLLMPYGTGEVEMVCQPSWEWSTQS